MEVSVCIVYRDDPFLVDTLYALTGDRASTPSEIIVVDDYSDTPLVVDHEKFPQVRVIRHDRHYGVGQSFDTATRNASFDTIILMGSDVIVQKGYLDTVFWYVSNYPYAIGCSVCLSGNPTHLNPAEPFNNIKRYGASIVPFVTQEDLRTDNQMSALEEYHVGLFQSRWIKQEPKDNITEIPCVYGAFYFTNKTWYSHLGGWDNSHKLWGSLECWLSLKNWLYGGKCHVVKELETLHIFEKFTQDYTTGVRPINRIEYLWYNQLFITYTMLDASQRDKLIQKVYDTRVKYELSTRPFNLGHHLIKQNIIRVNEVKDRNTKNFVHDFGWFCNKFEIERNY